MAGFIKRNLKVLLVLLIVGGSIGTYVGIKIADLPAFCGLLCHSMTPHVESLEANFHGKNGVICMDCHSHPGFFNHLEEHVVASVLVIPEITKIYLEDAHNLHANVPEFNAERLNFKGKTPAEQEEIFKECRRCHPNRLDKSYFMEAPHSKYEMITHNCMHCHQAVAKQAEPDFEKAKTVLYKRGTKAPRSMPNVHPLHLGMDVYCNSCHSRVVHNNDPVNAPMAMHDCTKCHDGEQAPFEDCKMCHVGIKNIFEGKIGKGVEETASFMLDIGCMDCHNAQINYAVNTQVCIDCHDDASYGNMVGDWQVTYNEKLAKASQSYKATKERLEVLGRKGKDLSAILSIFKDGEYNYRLAALDGSHGVHNPEFTTPLLDKVEHTFNEVNNMVDASLKR